MSQQSTAHETTAPHETASEPSPLLRVEELRTEFSVEGGSVVATNDVSFELDRGETMGLFQLNGSGMTRYLTDLKPSTIHDINAMVALYRPGPQQRFEPGARDRGPCAFSRAST